MARRNPAVQSKPAKSGDRAAALREVRGLVKSDGSGEIDRLIHDRVRLGVVSALAVAESMTFSELKATLKVTDGNLSAHARKLEDAGCVECRKTFVGRLPRTTYRLTPAGRAALQRYLGHIEALIAATKAR